LVVFIHVGSDPIVVGLIGGHPLVEVSEGDEVLQVEEFGFDGGVDGLDIAVVAPGPDGDSFVDGSEPLDGLFESIPGTILPVAADEFGTVVGLDLHALEGYPAGP
jgi:hypothetical protein